jgi:phosphatidylethanolamine-binding protein (PEBP) family uncharacterized protein
MYEEIKEKKLMSPEVETKKRSRSPSKSQREMQPEANVLSYIDKQITEGSNLSQINRHEAEIDIRKLKAMVSASFPKDHAIFALILTEKDVLSVSDFLSKSDCWLRLLGRGKN